MDLRMNRLAKRRSQREMAALIGVDPATYSRYESEPERMPLGKAVKLANYLGENVENFLSQEAN